MTKKKPEKEEPKFALKKRIPKPKPNFFQNVTPFSHPIKELLDSHRSAQTAANETLFETLDTQSENFGHSKNQNLDTQTGQSLDTQVLAFGHSNNIPPDTQNENSGHSNEENSDTQSENSGHSSEENPGVLTPKPKIRVSKKTESLSVQTPGEKSLDTQKKADYKKYDARRSTVRINLHLSKEIDRRVRIYCIESEPRIELKEFFELAAVRLLDTQTNENLGARTPHDDRRLMMLFKTKLNIINLHLAYTQNLNPKIRWTTADDEKGSSLNGENIAFVELGIIQTQFNKNFRGKINSFSYYMPEIENFLGLDVGGEALEMMLKINRQRWQSATGKTLDLSFLNEGEGK